MSRCIAVIGPTASGKTGTAIELAAVYGGEIVSCDSMQIYRGLDIGTAKPTAGEQEMVRHHLIDIRDPWQRYSVSDYVADATAAIKDIESRGKVPIICGGTGLYYSSLVKGITFTEEKAPDPLLRESIIRELETFGSEKLLKELDMADPEHAGSIEPGDSKRIVRSVELLRSTGMTVAQHSERSLRDAVPLDVAAVFLNYADRQKLYARINRRVDMMMEQGLEEEARTVFANRERYSTAAAAIGYKEFFPYFSGDADLSDCVLALKQASRNYAKRQLTWFRRESARQFMQDSADHDTIMDGMRRYIDSVLAGKGDTP